MELLWAAVVIEGLAIVLLWLGADRALREQRQILHKLATNQDVLADDMNEFQSRLYLLEEAKPKDW